MTAKSIRKANTAARLALINSHWEDASKRAVDAMRITPAQPTR